MKVAIKPITVNQVWQGRRYKTSEYIAWRAEFGILIGQLKQDSARNTGFYKPRQFSDGSQLKVQLRFHLNKQRYAVTDVDNLIKPTLDALVDCGILEDDRYVRDLRATKLESEEEAISIIIRKCNGKRN